MKTSASVLAEIMFQAAVAVGHHAKSYPRAAIYEGTWRTLPRSKAGYDAFTEACNIYCLVYQVHIASMTAKDFACEGPSWQMWLSKTVAPTW